MLRKTRLKQGTLQWEKARETRIGSSEIFDIVRYYATDEELQNCGINAEDFKSEKPYTTAWALYHKIKSDGLYKREVLPPEFAEYGHVLEPYGLYELQKNRRNKLKRGEVYASDKLIVSLDISGIAEEKDDVVFTYGNGKAKLGQKFICEQKTMTPQAVPKGLPYKYITQAQYQTTYTNADFFIIQVMILKEDTPFIRGKLCQMSRKKLYEYLDKNMTVKHYYFKNNVQFGMLIKVCIERFFKDVKEDKEPKAYIENDSVKNIVESIRLNSFYTDKPCNYNLEDFEKANELLKRAERLKKEELQRIINTAKRNNSCKFSSRNGTTAMFVKDGSFRVKISEVKK